MIKPIKYLLSVLASPLALFLVWVYNFRPYSYLAKLFNWSIHSKNPETIEAAINVALSVVIYNVIGKILTSFKRPIKVNLKVKDPTNKVAKNEIMYNANEGKLKKLVLEVEIDYKSNFWRILSTIFISHLVELHWSKIFQVNCDDIDNECMESSSRKLIININSIMSNHQNKIGITQYLYFTVKNSSVNRGAFVPEFKVLRDNVLLNFLIVGLLKLIVTIEIMTLDVHLEKEN